MRDIYVCNYIQPKIPRMHKSAFTFCHCVRRKKISIGNERDIAHIFIHNLFNTFQKYPVLTKNS